MAAAQLCIYLRSLHASSQLRFILRRRVHHSTDQAKVGTKAFFIAISTVRNAFPESVSNASSLDFLNGVLGLKLEVRT